MTETYGHLVRLWGINPSEFPPAGSTQEHLKPCIQSILLEALPFLDSVNPGTSSPLWKATTSKKFPGSTAPVQLYERTVSSEELEKVAEEYHLPQSKDKKAKIAEEFWVLRRSVHGNAATDGTASWEEFVKCFKEDHAQAELQFTPTVLDTKLIQTWDCTGITIEINGKTYEALTLKHEQSTHKIPAPLNNRLFPVLQVTASVAGRKEFVVVQIAARDTKEEEKKGGDVVRAAYTSVERVKELESGELEWIMGTASDARGNLPAWMQKMAIPGHVAKDVDMFLAWIAKERRTGKESEKGAAAVGQEGE